MFRLRKIPSFVKAGFAAYLFLACILAAISLCLQPAYAEESARIYFLHALTAKQEGDTLRAEGLLQRALNYEPQNPDFHFELGNLYIEGNNLQSARMEFEETLMLAPSHLAAHYNLGLVYRELGLMTEARDEFRKVLELDPRNVKAELQIGYVYQAEGFTEDASQAFETAREMDNHDPEPQQALEDLKQFESNLQARSRQKMADTLQRNQSLLYQMRGNGPYADLSSQPSAGKGSLLQSGMLVFEELMARRSQNQENTSQSQS